MTAKYQGITVRILNIVDCPAPDPRYNHNRTVAQTADGVVLLEHKSRGAVPTIAPWLDQLTDLSDETRPAGAYAGQIAIAPDFNTSAE